MPVEVEQRIIERHRAGHSPAAIAAQLNADGVPTAQGGKAWHRSTVRGVLRRLGA